MCFFTKSTKNKRFTKPQNILQGCRMIMIVDIPMYKYYIPLYCNSEVVKNGLCDVHKDYFVDYRPPHFITDI